MKKVLISGYYGFNNTGDEAMIETMSILLAKQNLGLIVLSANPEKTKELYNVQAYDRSRLGEVIKAIRQADLVISGGGTLFQDATSKKSIWYYLGIIKIAQMLKKKVCVAYQGIGPLHTKLYQKMTKDILNKKSVKWIALRDEQAIQLSKELGIHQDKVILSSDMIFMMQPPAYERSLKIINDNVHNRGENEKLIGFSIREWQEKDKTDSFARIADSLVEKFGARIVFFPFHKPKDAEVSKMIMQKMKYGDKAVLMPNRYLPSEILGAMGLMDVNIGVRLHSLVFSSVMNVPTMGISYDPKIDGFLEMLGLSPICTYDAIDENAIIEKVGKYLNSEKVNYTDKIEYFKRIGTETLDKILETI